MTPSPAATAAPTPVRSPVGAALLGVLTPLALVIGVALLMELIVGPRVERYTARVLLDVGSAMIFAVSLNIVNGYAGQFSIGHAGFLAIGGYVAGAITYYTSLLAWGSFARQGGFLGPGEWLMAGACLVGGLAAAAAGWLVGLPSLRLRGDYLAIVTLGFGEIVRVLLQQTNPQIFSAEALRQATGDQLIPPPLGGAQGFANIPKYTNLFWMYLFAALTFVFAVRLKNSSTGRALLSIREDEIAAQAMGVPVTRLKVRAFVLSALFAGIGGGLVAHQSGTLLRPVDAGFQRSFEFVIMVVLGGLGSISGAALAAALLTVLPQLLLDPPPIWPLGLLAAAIAVAARPRTGWRAALVFLALAAFWEVGRWLSARYGVNLAEYRMIIYALALILLMIFRPQGLLGVRELWDFLPGRGR